MDEERLVRGIERSVANVRLRGRPQLGWMANVRRALNERGLTLE